MNRPKAKLKSILPSYLMTSQSEPSFLSILKIRSQNFSFFFRTKPQQNEKSANDTKGANLASSNSNSNLDKNANVNNLKMIKSKTPTFKK